MGCGAGKKYTSKEQGGIAACRTLRTSFACAHLEILELHASLSPKNRNGATHARTNATSRVQIPSGNTGGGSGRRVNATYRSTLLFVVRFTAIHGPNLHSILFWLCLLPPSYFLCFFGALMQQFSEAVEG